MRTRIRVSGGQKFGRVFRPLEARNFNEITTIINTMTYKPFKPLHLNRRPSENEKPTSSEPPAKKRRISNDSDPGATTAAAAQHAALPKPAPKPGKTFLAHRAPLKTLNNGKTAEPAAKEYSGIESYYTVLWYSHLPNTIHFQY